MKITNTPFSALTVGVLLILSASTLHSCKKNEVKENAPVANIINPGNASFPVKTFPGDSTLFKNMIAYWRLDSTAKDYSGYGNNGVGHSMPATYTFDGRVSYVVIPDAPSLRLSNADFTISSSVTLTSFSSGTESEILDKRGGGVNNGWHLAIGGALSTAPRHVIFSTGDGGISVTGKDTIILNTTYMINVEYISSAHTVKLFITNPYEGKVELDTTVKNVPVPNAAGTAKIYIGRNNPAIGGDGSFLKGSISATRIYSRNITIAEMQRLRVLRTFPDNASGLLAYWPLLRNANDMSINHNNGTMHKITVTADRYGNAIGACKFNGKNSYISVNDNPLLRLDNTDFTLSAWVYITSYDASVGAEILSKRLPAANSGWSWAINGNDNTPLGAVSFGPGRGETTAYGVAPVPLNTWHMVTCMYTLSNHNLRIFIDGVLDNNVVSIASPNALINCNLYIGSNGDTPGSAHYFNGSISDIRIFNYALSNNIFDDLRTAIN